MNRRGHANVTRAPLTISQYAHGEQQQRPDDYFIPDVVEAVTNEEMGFISEDIHGNRVVTPGWYGLKYRDLPGAPPKGWRLGASHRVKMLDAFIALHQKLEPMEAVLAFARTWGVLDLCEAHARPCSHNRLGLFPGNVGDGFTLPLCEPRTIGEPRSVYVKEVNADLLVVGSQWKAEALFRWLEYSREFDAALQGAGNLRREPPPAWPAVPKRRAPYVTAVRLQDKLNYWIDQGFVREQLYWTPDGLRYTNVGAGLFGALVVALIEHIRNVDGLMFRCQGCGKWKPRNGRHRAWCDEADCKRARSAASSQANRNTKRDRRKAAQSSA